MRNGSDCTLAAQEPQDRQRSLFIAASKSTCLTWLFGAYVFLQFTVLALANHAGDGYLLFAAIGDRQSGRYVPILSLCIMLIALLNVVLVGDQNTYWFNMCLFYFSIAAFTSYYLLTFWRLAPGTKHPAIWAPMGRLLDSAMVLLTGMFRLSMLPIPLVLGVDIAGVALVILLMAIKGDFNLTGASAAETAAVTKTHLTVPDAAAAMTEALPRLSSEETLARLQEQYKLTPREAGVTGAFSEV